MTKLYGKAVEFIWEDAYSDDNAVIGADERIKTEPFLIKLMGYVIEDTREAITVAREDMCDGRYRSIQRVPRSLIRGKIRVIGRSRA